MQFRSHWTRRSVIQVGLASWAWERAWAQQPGRIYRLGCLVSAPENAPHHLALIEGLRRSGFVEGQNLTIDRGGYGLRSDQFDKHARILPEWGSMSSWRGVILRLKRHSASPRRFRYLH